MAGTPGTTKDKAGAPLEAALAAAAARQVLARLWKSWEGDIVDYHLV